MVNCVKVKRWVKGNFRLKVLDPRNNISILRLGSILAVVTVRDISDVWRGISSSLKSLQVRNSIQGTAN